MTTLGKIHEVIDKTAGRMLQLGLSRPEMNVWVKSNNPDVSAQAWWSNEHSERKYKIFTDAPFHVIEAQIDEWIRTLPSLEDRRRAEYAEALAKAIDIGKRNGIEDVLVNPLREAMERLSKNALVDMRTIADTDDIPF